MKLPGEPACLDRDKEDGMLKPSVLSWPRQESEQIVPAVGAYGLGLIGFRV